MPHFCAATHNGLRQPPHRVPTATTATLRDVLDERARELCGEHTRFYDLKRTGMLKDNTYLNATHPDLGQYFKPEYVLRPIPTPFLQGLNNGDEYQNPGY